MTTSETTLLFLATTTGLSFFIAFIIWTIVWKAIALWIAARKGSKVWFTALLILNTFSILEIAYIFYFSKRKIFKKVDEAIDKVIEKEDPIEN